MFDVKKIIRLLVLIPIRLYRLIISPLKLSCCRFHPSCSAYAIEAIEKHGVVVGLRLLTVRLLRCHPWSRASWIDPVPDVKTDIKNDN
jgi:putative membrane protein insertion efficiency factor